MTDIAVEQGRWSGRLAGRRFPALLMFFVLSLPLVVAIPPARAARIDFRGSSTGTGSPLTIPTPVGVRPGDVLVGSIAKHEAVGSGGDITAPPGWQLLSDPTLTDDLELAVYVKVAGEPEPDHYTWETGDRDANGAILAYAGVDPRSPIAAFNVAAESTEGTRIRVASFEVPVPDSVLVMFATVEGPKENPITPPDGFLRQAERAVHPSLVASDMPFPSRGATGDLEATAKSPASNLGIALALRPAGS